MIRKIFILLILGSLLFPSFSLAVTKAFQVDTGGTLTTNLVSYYKLEDINDYYSTNNLTNNGTVTFSSGKVNNSANISSGNYLSGNASTDFTFGTGDFAISFWVKRTTVDVQQAFFDLRATGAPTSLHPAIFVLANNKAFYYVNGSIVITSTSTLNINTYYHIVVTRISSVTRMYINGTQEGGDWSDTTNYASASANRPFIGYGSAGLDYPLTGQIDELGVWKGHGLSQTEISDLYNSGNGQTMTEVTASTCHIRGQGRCH